MYASTSPGLAPADFVLPARIAEPPFPCAPAEGRTFFFLARGAVYHLFRELRLRPADAVLVPDYHHGVEVQAMRAAGVAIRFYAIDRHLQPDLAQLERLARSGARVLYVIHYLGWPQPMPELMALCERNGLLLVEDCALALLSAPGGQPLGTQGDYSIFCLHKTLPLPDGGVLVQNRRGAGLEAPTLQRCGAPTLAARCAELLLESLRTRSGTSVPLDSGATALKSGAGRLLSALRVHRWAVGDGRLDPRQLNLAMSPLGHFLLRRLDLDGVRERRRRHFALLRRRLDGHSFLDEPGAGICPLFFPLLVKDKHAAARALRRLGIGAVEFWNRGDPAADGEGALFLRRHLLELPIHQDLSDERIERIARAVLEQRLALGA